MSGVTPAPVKTCPSNVTYGVHISCLARSYSLIKFPQLKASTSSPFVLFSAEKATVQVSSDEMNCLTSSMDSMNRSQPMPCENRGNGLWSAIVYGDLVL